MFFLVSFIPLLFFAPILMERMENYFVEQSQQEWLREANRVATKVMEGDYLKDSSNYTFFKSMIDAISKEKDDRARIVVVDKLGYIMVDSAGADLKRTVVNDLVFAALNKKDGAKPSKRDEQEIMSAAVPVVDKDNKDDVFGAVLVLALLIVFITP